MILIGCRQGEEPWFAARTGVITASKFKDAVEKTVKGKPTSKSTLYAAQVAVERVSGKPCDEGFNSWQMKIGQEREPMARLEYEAKTGNLVRESGVLLTDDRVFGYSMDGFVGDDGLIEIKCLSSALGLLEMWRDGDLSDYMHQIQGGLWISGRHYCDFVMYAPQLESVGKKLFTRRVERDESFIETLERDLWTFAVDVSTSEKILRAQPAEAAISNLEVEHA